KLASLLSTSVTKLVSMQ
ncbi:EscI/YscI/HrpB family type III secretion system inner rod protein, partial [Escherichia coli]|nr:EscI/YscI/HrpB family type III secretion system inner rod protein [Escherichia coli]EFC9263214.1 EscI/YscI/HrpB family type III secretion system inner rod protein [Escherichia coli]EHH7549896.1 EscI/YscI/HrpB family type III secretion system inner rod protein [Escherichia coli]